MRKTSKVAQEQALKKANKLADFYEDKLNTNGSLTDIEKIALRNIYKENNLVPDSITAEYLGLGNKISKGYKVGFFILLTLLICLGAYTGYYIRQSRDQITKLANELNSKQSDYSGLQSSYRDLQGKANSLQSQLNKKPSTVYVTQPAPKSSGGFTQCNPNGLGGIYCSTLP